MKERKGEKSGTASFGGTFFFFLGPKILLDSSITDRTYAGPCLTRLTYSILTLSAGNSISSNNISSVAFSSRLILFRSRRKEGRREKERKINLYILRLHSQHVCRRMYKQSQSLFSSFISQSESQHYRQRASTVRNLSNSTSL